MAEVTAALVKQLRDKTGAGMMDAKRALVEADGDFDNAEQLLKEKGLAKAATRSDRENTQGAVALAVDGDRAALVELKSETDFSAKSADFIKVSQDLADIVLAKGVDAVSELNDEIDQLKLTKKENIAIGTVALFAAAPGNILDFYLHKQDGRGTNAVLLETSGTDQETAHEIALHIAFAKPSALSRDEISQEDVDKARESLEGITRAEGKPEQAVPKIVEGRLNAWFADRVLNEQGFLGEKVSVAEKLGDGSIVRFVQVVIGG